MPAASDVTRLLDDIEARQQSVIEELDALLARIEAVIAEYAPAKPAEPAAGSSPLPAATSEQLEPAGEDGAQSDPEVDSLEDSDREDNDREVSDREDSEAAAKPRRRKKAA